MQRLGAGFARVYIHIFSGENIYIELKRVREREGEGERERAEEN